MHCNLIIALRKKASAQGCQYEEESHLVGASLSEIPDFVSWAFTRLPLNVKAAEPSAGRPSSRSEAQDSFQMLTV